MMIPDSTVTVFYGALVNPLTLRSYQALPKCLLAVSRSGVVDWIVEDVEDSMVQQVIAQQGAADVQVIDLKHGEFLMPGFVDTHTIRKSGQQYELLDWLKHITFPMETKFADATFAHRIYESVVCRTIDSGTTTCCYYATLHLEATNALANVVHRHGQRAFVGKCNMDRNSPDHYVESSARASLEATKASIAHIRSLPSSASGPLVLPILTPRFAISCTDELLSDLGQLATSDPALHIQTHISENPSEIALTKELFPACVTYADVYDHFGLLRENTVLAHGVHLEESELQLIRERKAGISHCPTSNFNLSSGIARVGAMLDRGIKVGLGTDVSGGFCPSVLTAVQHASIASKVIALHNDSSSKATDRPFAGRPLPISALLHLSTLGGAQVCCLDDRIGSFAPGKNFDALLVSLRNRHGNPGLWGVPPSDDIAGIDGKEGKELVEDLLERFLFCGDDRNIKRVYVQGKIIGGTEFGRPSY